MGYIQLTNRKGFLIETKRVSDEAVELYNPTIIRFLFKSAFTAYRLFCANNLF